MPSLTTLPPPAAMPRVQVGHLVLDALTETAVVDHVARGIATGRGGQVVTPNLDIWLRTRQRPEAARAVDECDLSVPDGMPLLWAARLAGTPLPERVTGSSLVETLAQRGAREGWRLFVIGGGDEGAGEAGLEALLRRYPGLVGVGACTPQFGFERDPEQLERLVAQVVDARPDLVYVGLGFPKQETLGALLRARLPRAWFIGCGAAVQMAAGHRRRAPRVVQRAGGEWVWRLAQDPRRLARRYLVDDAAAAVVLLAGTMVRRLRRA